METSHVIPVLVFGDTLGRTCLPLSIEAQDFQTALHQAPVDADDRLLVEQWYHSDQQVRYPDHGPHSTPCIYNDSKYFNFHEQAQPPCYRLQSAPAMVNSIFHL